MTSRGKAHRLSGANTKTAARINTTPMPCAKGSALTNSSWIGRGQLSVKHQLATARSTGSAANPAASNTANPATQRIALPGDSIRLSRWSGIGFPRVRNGRMVK